MAHLGQAGLLLALVLSGYGTLAALVGRSRRRGAWLDSARLAAYAVLLTVVVVNAAMLVALLSDDFTLRYVALNSSVETPTFFKALSLWAADDGSLLLWNLVLAGYAAAVAWRFRRSRPAGFPVALGVMFAVQTFYLTLVNGPARPFATLALAPLDGRGPAPLLQNHPLMAVHPPFLYLGFIGFTVPFAFGIASLVNGSAPDRWVEVIRGWTVAVWCFLTVGLALGALWSYSVLGWGGYWAWDPVENVALLPWLVATAFLHSVMLQRRSGMAALWNVSLVVGAFALTTFGTFLTRGSVLTSIHAFTESTVGPAYLAFLTLVLLGGFGLVVWRLPTLRSPARMDSALSREAALVGNNVLLLAATGIVLLGTVFPLVAELVSDQQLTVGRPYFESAVAPVLLLLLLLMGTGPLLPWRGGTATRVLPRLRLPATVAALATLALAVGGVRPVTAVLGLGLAILVIVGNGRELATVVRSGTGRRRLWRGSRRYGGLLVHVGLALLAAGVVASSALGQHAEVTVEEGQSVGFAGYQVRYDGLRTDREPHRTVLTAALTVMRDGADQQMTPRLNLYPAASEPIASPSIDRGPVWDLYTSVIALQDNGDTVTLRLLHTPGVNWLWLGALVMTMGGVLAGWPHRPRRRRSGAPAVTPVAEPVPVGAPS
jgi:cytochrome c-type biogenesis protein CcmF